MLDDSSLMLYKMFKDNRQEEQCSQDPAAILAVEWLHNVRLLILSKVLGGEKNNYFGLGFVDVRMIVV